MDAGSAGVGSWVTCSSSTFSVISTADVKISLSATDLTFFLMQTELAIPCEQNLDDWDFPLVKELLFWISVAGHWTSLL